MYQRILVPVDGSATSLQGLQEAVRLAKLTGGSIRLLHVVDDLSVATSVDAMASASPEIFRLLKEGGETILAKARATVEAAGVPVDVHLCETFGTRLADVVCDEVQRFGAELVVLGTHGRRGVGRLVLGSGAEQVLRAAPVPVLLVRAPA